jgi:inosine-uridine nucleoside N-ribohydrolase
LTNRGAGVELHVTIESAEADLAKRKLILDVDTDADDAVAIMLAALHPDLENVAASRVFGAGLCKLTLVPLDATHKATVSLDRRKRLRASGRPAAQDSCVAVETAGTLTVGRTAVDTSFRSDRAPNARVAMTADTERLARFVPYTLMNC